MNTRAAVVLLASAALLETSAHAETFQITNPLVAQRADPDIYRHTDGYYYFTATVPTYNRIELRRATTIQGLATATPTVLWKAHASGAMATHIWAPELHSVQGTWYIYFAAGSSTNTWDIRVYLLENPSPNPIEGTWSERGQVVTNGRSDGTFFALDATTFEHGGTRYMVWAEADPTHNGDSSLFIAPMSNPWTLASRGVRISAPDYAWETVRYRVNEGPAVLKRNGRIFIAYSASGTGAEYCMGLLTASDTSDLLAPASWAKSPTPVFKSANGVYGPGHNQFTTSADGILDLLVYHGRNYETIVGDPLNDPDRATRVQVLGWKADGTPNFGAPQPDGTLTIRTDAEDASDGDAAAMPDAEGTSDTGSRGDGSRYSDAPEPDGTSPVTPNGWAGSAGDDAASTGDAGGKDASSSGLGQGGASPDGRRQTAATGGRGPGGGGAGTPGTGGSSPRSAGGALADSGTAGPSGGGCGCRTTPKSDAMPGRLLLGFAFALGLIRRRSACPQSARPAGSRHALRVPAEP